MNIKKVTIVFLIICIIFTVCGCGVSRNVNEDLPDGVSDLSGNNEDEQAADQQTADKQPADEEAQADESSDAPAESGEDKTAGKDGLNQISDFSDAWNNRYTMNEAAINNCEEVMLELATPGLQFVTGVQYDLLNMDNADGRFDGELMLAGYPAFLERAGSKMNFGFDFIREKDGFGPTAKAGDRLVESGDCDLDQGVYRSENSTERDGKVISRTYSEFKLLDSGEMICFMTYCNGLNLKGEENTSNYSLYIKAGKDQYDFVLGKANTGTSFDKITIIDKNDLTKDEARSLMENAGFTIEKTGGISGDKLVID